MSDRPVILFSSHNMMLPVIKQLKDDYAIGVLDKGMSDSLTNLDIESVSLNRAVDGEVRESAFLEAARMIHAAVDMRGFDEKLSPAVSKFVGVSMPAFIYPRIADLAAMVIGLDKVNPAMAVVHNDVEPLLRTVALWCKARSKPCLHVPHAVYQDINRGAVGTDVHDIVTSSNLSAAGVFQRLWYEQRGMGPLNIKETGLPQWDKWASVPYDRAKAFRLLKLKPYVPTITYITTWRQNTNMFGCNDEWAQVYADFLTAIKKIETPVQVIVKGHPNSGQDSLNWHINLAKEASVKCVVTAMHLELIVLATDLMIAPFGSNTLIEAATMPHVRLATMEGHGYFDDDAVLKFKSGDEGMLEGITEALSQEPADTAAFKAKYGGLMDGKAHLRVADYVRELMV